MWAWVRRIPSTGRRGSARARPRFSESSWDGRSGVASIRKRAPARSSIKPRQATRSRRDGSRRARDAQGLGAPDVRHAAVLRDPQHDRTHRRQGGRERRRAAQQDRQEAARHPGGGAAHRAMGVASFLSKTTSPRTACRMASATSLPRLPTSPTGPTQDGQPSRHAQAAMSASLSRDQPVVQPVERLATGRCRPGSCRR